MYLQNVFVYIYTHILFLYIAANNSIIHGQCYRFLTSLVTIFQLYTVGWLLCVGQETAIFMDDPRSSLTC